ncbi:uncharacterized protein An07g08790 [Aspergillus niger]|uniref:Contig An07c0300, genomic contig n=3 Tax=Aspergillus niger TaxID=5061 RepID=A2QPA7_ASPNC|nr:uncharacterized protein An07g08790 [Aspergillus niger]CAK39672.1 unnamed protein product [Aspergillus niger]
MPGFSSRSERVSPATNEANPSRAFSSHPFPSLEGVQDSLLRPGSLFLAKAAGKCYAGRDYAGRCKKTEHTNH